MTARECHFVVHLEYCFKEMSCPIEDYRDQLSRERQQGSVHQQRFTMTRFPFLLTGADEIIVLRYQWVVDRFFGQMLYWPTFFSDRCSTGRPSPDYPVFDSDAIRNLDRKLSPSALE